MNLASRMESTGVPGMIQIAESTRRLCGERYPLTPREVDVKGLGMMRTYLLDPRAVVAGDPGSEREGRQPIEAGSTISVMPP